MPATPADHGPTERRPWRVALALGLVVGVTAGALALSVVALPLFFFARAADPA
ncbi:MAG: hypothetical protein QOI20_1878, partial [Acidimicrobiaceae bacterium]|nr:hypothetical protein [Acidimicrobiaceae bacterium]